jgi:ATP/maltotriose-dependent transcriptional regulator MalT
VLPDTQRAQLLELHATECNLTNQIHLAIASADEALSIWRRLDNVAAQSRALRILSRQHWALGRKKEADECIVASVELLETLPKSRDLAMAYSMRSQLAMLSGGVHEALEFGQRALDLAREFGDPETESHALNNIGASRLGSGDQGGRADLERSLAIALKHRLSEHAARGYVNLATSCVLSHDSQLAARYLRQGITYCDEHQIEIHLNYLRAYEARYRMERGSFEEASQLATRLLQNGALTPVQRIPALVTLALCRIRRGQPGVDEVLDEALELAMPTRELQRIGRVATALAEAAWFRGDVRAMETAVNLGLEHAAQSLDLWIRGELWWWKSRIEPTLELPARIAEPYRLMIAGRCTEAAALWAASSMPYEQALALSEGSEEEMKTALGLAESLQASALAAVIRDRLRNRGVRGLPRGPRTTTRDNPAGLTTRELQVLKLLARGHTNAELARQLHLSPRTIDRHVSTIFDKLAVRSRAEATAAAFQRGIVSTAGD